MKSGKTRESGKVQHTSNTVGQGPAVTVPAVTVTSQGKGVDKKNFEKSGELELTKDAHILVSKEASSSIRQMQRAAPEVRPACVLCVCVCGGGGSEGGGAALCVCAGVGVSHVFRVPSQPGVIYFQVYIHIYIHIYTHIHI